MKKIITYFSIFCCLINSHLTAQDNPHFEQAKQLFTKENYSAALEEVKLSLIEQPKLDSALYLKAYCFVKLKRFKEADNALKQLQKISPDFYEVYLLKGLMLALNEKYYNAIACFDKVLKFNPKHQKALFNSALSKAMLDDYDAAIADLDMCIANYPTYAIAYYSRAYWNEVQEKYDNAIIDYKKAIELDKHYSEAYIALAYVYSQNGEDVNACETLNKAKAEGIEIAADLLQNTCK